MINLPLPKIIAHRGASAYAPENTLAALRLAAEMGASWIEFDAMLTKDDEVIIMHDETLDRTTNGKGEVAQMPYQEIAKLDAGSWFSKQFADEHVPTLYEWLDYLQQHRLQMNLEIKPTLNRDAVTTEKIIKILQQEWSLDKSIPLLSSASESALSVAQTIAPNLPLGWIVDEWHPEWHQKLKQWGCVSMHINHEALDQQKVELVKSAGYYLLAYTVNDRERAQQLFNWGVDSVFTDYPDLLTQAQIDKKKLNKISS